MHGKIAVSVFFVTIIAIFAENIISINSAEFPLLS